MEGSERRWIEQRLDGIDRLVEEVRGYLASSSEDSGAAGDPGYMAWFRRMGGFLNAVEEAGGRVRQSELLRLAKLNGYDTRGTAGFYRGAQAMLRVHDDGTRELTEVGRERAKEWRETFGQAA